MLHQHHAREVLYHHEPVSEASFFHERVDSFVFALASDPDLTFRFQVQNNPKPLERYY